MSEFLGSTIRLAVALIGLITLCSIVAVAVLLWGGRDAPEGLIAIGAGGVGALATLLTTTASRSEGVERTEGRRTPP